MSRWLIVLGVAILGATGAAVWKFQGKEDVPKFVPCAGAEEAIGTAAGFTWIGCPDKPFIWLHSYAPLREEKR